MFFEMRLIRSSSGFADGTSDLRFLLTMSNFVNYYESVNPSASLFTKRWVAFKKMFP